MNEKFEVIFLTEARAFLLGLDEKSRDKIIFKIDKAKIKISNELFKKIKGEIWEFRTLYNRIRLPDLSQMNLSPIYKSV